MDGDNMGFIYKISNKINDKIYIGQTKRSVTERFYKHLYDCDREGYDKYLLYKAMRKYGKDNFYIEVIEEVEDSQLDIREKYWISILKTFGENGYNMTIGGKANRTFSYSDEEIIELYHKYKSSRKVAKYLNCDHSTIDKILNYHKVSRYSFGLQRGNGKIKIKKNNFEKEFDCINYCAKWFIDNQISRSSQIDCVRKGISKALKNSKPYFQYEIYNID